MGLGATARGDRRELSQAEPGWLSSADGAFDALLAELADEAALHDRDGSFPESAFRRLVAIGVHRLTAPASHGGFGAGIEIAASVVQRLGAADPSVGLVVLWQFLFLAELAREGHGWPARARRAVLESVRDEGAWINAVNVEPELGSPARGGLPATRARRQVDGSWRVSGHKIYATGIPVLRWVLLSVTLEDDGPPRQGVVLVDTRKEGLSIEPTWDHIGLRASGSHDLRLGQVVVEGDFVISDSANRPPASYAGWRLASACVLMSSLYNGIAHAARDWLLGYLNHRTPSGLGAPLATLPRFQTAVGQIELQLETSDRLLRDIAAAIAGGTEAERKRAEAFAPLLKHLVTSNAIAISSSGLELTGNPGHSRHNPLERHHRDALTGRIHTPQPDFALLNAGKAALAGAAAAKAPLSDLP